MATFIIDWPTLALIGTIFGAFAPGDRWWRSRAFVAGLVTAVTFTLVAMVSYAVAPDWMWMYLLDPDEVRWVVPLIPPAYLAMFGLAFAAAVGLRPIGRSVVWIAVAVAGVSQVVMIAITWDRYRFVGSAPEWLRGEANALFTISPAGDAKTIGSLSPIFVVVAVIAFILVVRGRRASAPGR